MFNWKEDVIAQNAIYLDDEVAGKGRQFKSRFLVPGLVKYDYGVCLLTKENADRFIQDFVGCPVIINHQDVTDRNAKEVSVGNIFSVWFDEKDGYYWCNGIITDKHAIELIDKGYSVSCQYTITEYSDNLTGALHNGNPYDKIIEDGKPEHLAIVNNPRYEGAIIAVNAIMAQNEDKWITIKPNGEENKGRHLLLKDGESVEDAMHRNGWYKKRQAKEGKEDKQGDKKEDKKEEKSGDTNIQSKLKKYIEKSKETAKNPKFYDGFDVEVKDGIVRVKKDGVLSKTGFKYDEGATDDKGEDWNTGALGNLIQKWNNENPKQEEKKEQTLDDKIKEHEDKIPKAYRRNTKTKALWLYKNHYISPTEFESAQKASNAFIAEFKDLLYQTLSEGIVNRLGELIASNEDKWITIHPHGKESDDYRRLKIKEGETVEEAMHRQGYYNKRKAGDEKKEKDEKALKEEKKQLYQDILKAKEQGDKDTLRKLKERYFEIEDLLLKVKDKPEKMEKKKVHTFTEATNIKDALQETNNYIENIQPAITKMSLDNLNKINNGLNYIYHNVCKFKSLEKIKKSRMDALAAADGESMVIGSMFDFDAQKSKEEFDKEVTNWKTDNEKSIELIEKSNYYTSQQKINKIKQCQENLKYNRFGVYSKPENLIKETIIHELGHTIAFQAMDRDQENGGKISFGYGDQKKEQYKVPLNSTDTYVTIRDALYKARQTGDIYKISKYANKDYQEFFAECFLMYNIGEKQPDYIKAMVEKVIKKL